MPSASFTTLGCKVNQYETQKILQSFEAGGFLVVPFDSPADVVVINTCSVTSDAEAKSRAAIRRARRSSPDAKIVVTGCAAQMSLIKGIELDQADIIVPNPQKLEALRFLADQHPSMVAMVPAENSLLAPPPGRTRATIKVQDGCSVMCSYCSIPYTRPGMVSRPWTDVLAEAKACADQGVREAILTGVLIGAYGEESGSGGPDFEDLVEILAVRSGLARLRISSIEMHQVTPRLIAMIQSGAVVPHLHIPLQSGDSRVLRDMNRRYDQAEYLRLCAEAQRAIPDLQITTDIMVGFPTEDEAAFESSLEVVRRVGYLKVHAFRFSPRHGTPADQWGDPVSPQAKQDRAKRLSALAEEMAMRRMDALLGSRRQVLVEKRPRPDGLREGVADNSMTVRFSGPNSCAGELAWVELQERRGMDLYGELVSEPRPTLPMAV